MIAGLTVVESNLLGNFGNVKLQTADSMFLELSKKSPYSRAVPLNAACSNFVKPENTFTLKKSDGVIKLYG